MKALGVFGWALLFLQKQSKYFYTKDAYIADNKFRKRDPHFADADRYKPEKKKKAGTKFKNTDFIYNKKKTTCRSMIQKYGARNAISKK
jgi:hypothetical protein